MAGKASGKSVDRLPVTDETEADRRTIEIYQLATRKLRVGRVPLLFKALAAEKALLPCWHAMRPAIRVRAFEEAADDLRARAAQIAVDLGCPLIETQLEWAGYDVDKIDEIRGQVDIFHYINAKLLMAAGVLAEALQGGVGGVSRGPRGEQRVPRGVPQDMDPIELVAEDAARQLPIRVEMTVDSLRAAGADVSRVRALVQRFRRALPALVLDLALFKVQLDGAESARESPFPIRWKYISSDEYTTVGLDEPVKLRAGDPKDLDEVSDEPH